MTGPVSAIGFGAIRVSYDCHSGIKSRPIRSFWKVLPTFHSSSDRFKVVKHTI